MLHEIKAHENFAFTSVKGDYGEAIRACIQYVVWLEAPRELRLQRVKERSLRKFGDRILPGGDLYEQEEGFFSLVQSRAEDTVQTWLETFDRPVLRLDGTKPVEENVRFVMEWIFGGALVKPQPS